jgi:hypothetical protein
MRKYEYETNENIFPFNGKSRPIYKRYQPSFLWWWSCFNSLAIEGDKILDNAIIKLLQKTDC